MHGRACRRIAVFNGCIVLKYLLNHKKNSHKRQLASRVCVCACAVCHGQRHSEAVDGEEEAAGTGDGPGGGAVSGKGEVAAVCHRVQKAAVVQGAGSCCRSGPSHTPRRNGAQQETPTKRPG